MRQEIGKYNVNSQLLLGLAVVKLFLPWYSVLQ